jgi:hypothetical protein
MDSFALHSVPLAGASEVDLVSAATEVSGASVVSGATEFFGASCAHAHTEHVMTANTTTIEFIFILHFLLVSGAFACLCMSYFFRENRSRGAIPESIRFLYRWTSSGTNRRLFWTLQHDTALFVSNVSSVSSS